MLWVSLFLHVGEWQIFVCHIPSRSFGRVAQHGHDPGPWDPAKNNWVFRKSRKSEVLPREGYCKCSSVRRQLPAVPLTSRRWCWKKNISDINTIWCHLMPFDILKFCWWFQTTNDQSFFSKISSIFQRDFYQDDIRTMGHDYLPTPQCLSKATFFTNLEAVPFMSTLSMLSLDFEVFSVRFWRFFYHPWDWYIYLHLP